MKKFLLYFFLITTPLVAVYVYYYYFNVVEDGQREGKLYNFSKAKGNIIKTAEGIMIQPGIRTQNNGGVNTNEFHFSVENKAVADSLSKVIGQTVVVRYIKYRKSLFWRGENNNSDNKDPGQFIITDIIKVMEGSQEIESNFY